MFSAETKVGRKISHLSPQDIVASGLCIGCGACLGTAKGTLARMDMDSYGQFKPRWDSGWPGESHEDFPRICPFSPSARNEDDLAASHFPSATHCNELIGCYEAAFVGYSAEGEYRSQGSSGGLVSWFAAELMQQGLVDGVAHVVANDQAGQQGELLFRYRISRNQAELREGAKSRYYPVELSEVLREILAVPSRYAVVGIPCFIKAVRLRCAEDPILAKRVVFTLGLFCGHMKSARMAESFAWQMGASIEHVSGLDYRVKNPDKPANWYRAQIKLRDGTVREQDWWHLADGDWGAGFFQNSACNFCDDVVAETADISFGDAWLEPYSSDGRGTNVVIIRNSELLEVAHQGIAAGRLVLSEVDQEFVIATQAAGLRQRREGLAFRLAWPRSGVCPRKRVRPRWSGLTARRVCIYGMRYLLSAWSHRIFWTARLLRLPRIYIMWARGSLASYQALAYSRGLVGRLIDRLGLRDTK
jgi:coenzyme F420-reducing hydrogenase beta subunit